MIKTRKTTIILCLIALLCMFSLLTECTGHQKDNLMRDELLRLQELNTNDARMDTVNGIHETYEYFKSHGSNHDKMMACYMMGRSYHDMGDAPRALRYYHDAVGFADTTDADCDYKTLSRIYGQIATIFHMQRSPRLELETMRIAEKSARKANDTIAALIFYEHLSDAYHLMDMMDSVLYYGKAAYDSFIKYGYEQLAAGSLPVQIEYYIRYNKLDTSKVLINMFEQKSGYFDTDMNIAKGMESFYSRKGQYYEKTGNIDSALYFYRKLLRYNTDINNIEAAYKGLMSVYHKMGQSDSAVKYAKLFVQANDSSNIIHSAEEINRMQAVYNYNESLRLATINEKEAEKKQLYIYIIIGIVTLLSTILYLIWKKQRANEKAELASLNSRYFNTLSQYDKAQEDLFQIKMDQEAYRIKKEKEIEGLKEKLLVFFDDKSQLELLDTETLLLSAPIVNSLHKLATKGKAPSDTHWHDFESLVSDHLPDFYQKIHDPIIGLTDIEIVACTLIKFRFIPSELAVLLNLTKQRITNIRSDINSKLFQTKGTKSLDFSIRRL